MILAPLVLAGGWLAGVLYQKVTGGWKKDAAALYINGILLLFCLAGIVALPLVKVRAPFTLYARLAGLCMAAACAAGLAVFIRDRRKGCGEKRRERRALKPAAAAAFGMAGLVFLGLAAAPFLYEPSVGADMTAETVSVTLASDTMFEYNPATGGPLEIGIYPQSKLQILPLAYGMLCLAGGEEIPVLLYHMVPFFILCMSYLVAWKWSGFLFGWGAGGQDEKRGLFLLFFGALLLFGDYYGTTYSYRLLHEAWKGESILFLVVLPYLACLCMELMGRADGEGVPFSEIGSILLCLLAGIFLAPWKLGVGAQALTILLFGILWGVRRGWLWLQQKRS